MRERAPISSYLELLDHELRAKRVPRRRLLAEAEDHLRSIAEELVEGGVPPVDAEGTAVARFGAAADVARRFAHAAAASAARTALAWAGGAFIAYAVTATFFLAAAPAWLHDFPQGAPTTVALQVAAVALGLTAIRALGWRRTLVMDEERLRLVANGALTAALALGAGAGAELVVAITRPAAAPWEEAAPLIAAFAVAAGLCVPAALVAVAGRTRANPPPRRPRVGERLTLAADLEAVVPALGGLAHAALRRPARLCAATAAAAFLAVTVMQLLGGDTSGDASLFAGALAVGLFEAAAVVAGYLTLGRALGLRGGTRTEV